MRTAMLALPRIITSLLLLPGSLLAANHYVRDGASGSGNGSDWTNACDDFASSCAAGSLTRGDTYYVADGTYGRVSFNTAASGTSLITIKKATAADHGTETGWSSTYGDGAARWFVNSAGGSDLVSFSTRYWIFDGVTGGGPSAWKTGFGFEVDTTITTDTAIATSAGNVTIRHVKVIGDGGDGDGSGGSNDGIYADDDPNGGNNLFEYLYVYDQGRVPFFIRSHNTTIQYSWMENNESTTNEHSEGISAWIDFVGTNINNLTVRYTVWKDIEGTGTIVCDCDGWDIYGNIFWGVGGAGTGHGAITTWSGALDDALNLRAHSNTFISTSKGLNFFIGDGSPGRSITGYNNLFYDTDAVFEQVATHNYSWCGLNSGTACTSEANDQVGSGSPFVDLGADNFRLTADTNAWTALGSPYNVDMYGVTRTSSRGAIQFESGGSTAPTVSTTAASSITTTTASTGGNVTSDGGASVTSRGTCYATSSNPTTPCTSDGTGTGAFSSSLTGLSASTLYHIRAFATNSVGTSYGSDLTFTTSAAATPVSRMSGQGKISGKTKLGN